MGISVTQLLIILAIIIVLFGTKRLRNLGGDLGGAIKGFRSSMKEGESKITDDNDNNTLEGEVSSKQEEHIEK